MIFLHGVITLPDPTSYHKLIKLFSCQRRLLLSADNFANSLDPDQDQHSVGPDLGPNCFQRLSADDTSRQRVKICLKI